MNASLEIASAAGLITVQDGGRPGHMHEGVPRGGALVPELLARANRAAGNCPGAPALEVFGQLTVRVLDAARRLATEDGGARVLRPGEALALKPSHRLRVRYLAAAGGIAVPHVLGGQGTLLAAGFGGFDGRALRRGDVVPVGMGLGAATSRSPAEPSELDLEAPVRVVPGPDLAAFQPGALEALLSSTWSVLPSSDRTGTRLAGPVLARRGADGAASMPMVPGAIQVPLAGAPIVLGPDHPTTGGYPLLAVVLRADLGRFAARRVRAQVRFRAVHL